MKELIIVQTFDKDGFLTGYEVKGEVVRCKDCEYWKPIDQFFGECLHFPNGLINDINWFCADGERRETDEAD